MYTNNNAGSHYHTVRDLLIIFKEIIKFSASSLLGFLIDYGLFSLLLLMTSGLTTELSLPISNIIARVISASANFSVNRRLVFKSDKSVATSALQYFGMAAVILLINTVLLQVLVIGFGSNDFLSKLLVGLALFAVSWLVQRFLVFAKDDSKNPVLVTRSRS